MKNPDRYFVDKVFDLLKTFLIDFIEVEIVIELAYEVQHNFLCFFVLCSRQFSL